MKLELKVGDIYQVPIDPKKRKKPVIRNIRDIYPTCCGDVIKWNDIDRDIKTTQKTGFLRWIKTTGAVKIYP